MDPVLDLGRCSTQPPVPVTGDYRAMAGPIARWPWRRDDGAVAPSTNRLAMAGRIVTLDQGGQVLGHGVVYIEDGVVRDVLPRGARPPDGVDDITPVNVRGTVYRV
jgi:hypothetical protein